MIFKEKPLMQKRHGIHSLQRVRVVEADRKCAVVWAAEGEGTVDPSIQDVMPAL